MSAPHPAFKAAQTDPAQGSADEDYDEDEYTESEPRQQQSRTPLSPHFFRREPDGTVKLRMKLSAEEAALIEEAAAKTPLMLYMHRVLTERAKYHISRNNKEES